MPQMLQLHPRIRSARSTPRQGAQPDAGGCLDLPGRRKQRFTARKPQQRLAQGVCCGGNVHGYPAAACITAREQLCNMLAVRALQWGAWETLRCLRCGICAQICAQTPRQEFGQEGVLLLGCNVHDCQSTEVSASDDARFE